MDHDYATSEEESLAGSGYLEIHGHRDGSESEISFSDTTSRDYEVRSLVDSDEESNGVEETDVEQTYAPTSDEQAANDALAQQTQFEQSTLSQRTVTNDPSILSSGQAYSQLRRAQFLTIPGTEPEDNTLGEDQDHSHGLFAAEQCSSAIEQDAKDYDHTTYLRLNRPMSILYHGPYDQQDLIVQRFAEALHVPVFDEERLYPSRHSSTTYTFLPVSSSNIEAVPTLGNGIQVHECKARGMFSAPQDSFQLAQSCSDRIHDMTVRPDMAVYFHAGTTQGSSQSICAYSNTAAEAGIPILEIVDGNHTVGITERVRVGGHNLLDIAEKHEKVAAVSFVDFRNMDARLLNQKLAILIQPEIGATTTTSLLAMAWAELTCLASTAFARVQALYNHVDASMQAAFDKSYYRAPSKRMMAARSLLESKPWLFPLAFFMMTIVSTVFMTLIGMPELLMGSLSITSTLGHRNWTMMNVTGPNGTSTRVSIFDGLSLFGAGSPSALMASPEHETGLAQYLQFQYRAESTKPDVFFRLTGCGPDKQCLEMVPSTPHKRKHTIFLNASVDDEIVNVSLKRINSTFLELDVPTEHIYDRVLLTVWDEKMPTHAQRFDIPPKHLSSVSKLLRQAQRPLSTLPRTLQWLNTSQSKSNVTNDTRALEEVKNADWPIFKDEAVLLLHKWHLIAQAQVEAAKALALNGSTSMKHRLSGSLATLSNDVDTFANATQARLAMLWQTYHRTWSKPAAVADQKSAKSVSRVASQFSYRQLLTSDSRGRSLSHRMKRGFNRGAYLARQLPDVLPRPNAAEFKQAMQAVERKTKSLLQSMRMASLRMPARLEQLVEKHQQTWKDKATKMKRDVRARHNAKKMVHQKLRHRRGA
ncbi:hypothetical protein MRB53_041782 [Persea americana]|nr:hypothetical protein MRB53_041782 [Persea americana]